MMHVAPDADAPPIQSFLSSCGTSNIRSEEHVSEA